MRTKNDAVLQPLVIEGNWRKQVRKCVSHASTMIKNFARPGHVLSSFCIDLTSPGAVFSVDCLDFKPHFSG
jgi:hypothetical protein